MNADGSDQKNLTHSTRSELGAAWSPDGRSIAYVRRIGGLRRLFVMNVDGSKERQVGGPGNQLVPAWAPASRPRASG